jgi:hypothetical protein
MGAHQLRISTVDMVGSDRIIVDFSDDTQDNRRAQPDRLLQYLKSQHPKNPRTMQMSWGSPVRLLLRYRYDGQPPRAALYSSRG